MEAFFVFWEKDKQKYVYSIYLNKEGEGGGGNYKRDKRYKIQDKQQKLI